MRIYLIIDTHAHTHANTYKEANVRFPLQNEKKKKTNTTIQIVMSPQNTNRTYSWMASKMLAEQTSQAAPITTGISHFTLISIVFEQVHLIRIINLKPL